MTELSTEDQQRELDRQSAETRAALGVQSARIKADADTAKADAEQRLATLRAEEKKQADDKRAKWDADTARLLADTTAAAATSSPGLNVSANASMLEFTLGSITM